MMRNLVAALALTLAAGALPALAALENPRSPQAIEPAPAASVLTANQPTVVKRCTSRGGWRLRRSYYAAATKCV